MNSIKSKIAIDLGKTSAAAGEVVEDVYRCRRDANGKPQPQVGQPAVFLFVERGDNPGGGVIDQSLYLDIVYSHEGRGGTIRYGATNGGRFVVPACDRMSVGVALVGSFGPAYTYSIITAWEQPASGQPGTFTTRQIALPAGAESVAIPVPPGFREFFAEGTGTAANLAATIVRKYRGDGTLISRHDGAEDMMLVSGDVAWLTYQSAVIYNLSVNFLAYFS